MQGKRAGLDGNLVSVILPERITSAEQSAAGESPLTTSFTSHVFLCCHHSIYFLRAFPANQRSRRSRHRLEYRLLSPPTYRMYTYTVVIYILSVLRVVVVEPINLLIVVVVPSTDRSPLNTKKEKQHIKQVVSQDNPITKHNKSAESA